MRIIYTSHLLFYKERLNIRIFDKSAKSQILTNNHKEGWVLKYVFRIVAGNGITTSIKYKALTTVAVGEKGKESDIKTGTRVDSTYSNIKIGNNPVTTYESVQYDNTTIPSFYPDLIYNVKKQ
ncbi:MAG: hypothetical protein PHY90_09155 [Desulfitobacteriaceae bacterium]|nr:hypothetical protein [Desulfitobacteriaceae bacterium]